MHLCNLHHAQQQCALRTCKSLQRQHLHIKNNFKFKDRLHTVAKRSASMGQSGSFCPIPFFGAAILWTTLLLILTEAGVVCGQQDGLPPPCPLCLQKPPRIPGIPREKQQHKHEKKKPHEAHETPKALMDLRQYLQQYGYLETPPWGKTPVLKEMGEAIGLFQRCFGLPETKSLDAITYEKISQPRCGQPDYVGTQPDCSVARKFAPFLRANVVGRLEELSRLSDNSGVGPPGDDEDDSQCLIDSSAIVASSDPRDGRDATPGTVTRKKCVTSRTSARRDTSGRSVMMKKAKDFAYFFGNPRWPTTRYKLTWSLSPTNVTRRLSRDEVRVAFIQAFEVWQKTVPVFAFEEAEDYESADVKISFVSGDHGDSQNFDGVLGIIAHAFSPEDGRVHFDDAEFWSADVTKERHMPHALDLVSVAIHEVGHVIGLAHSPVKKSVMFPSLPPHREKRKLSADDVRGARELYGLLQDQGRPLAPGPRAARLAPRPAIGLGNVNNANAHLSYLVLTFLTVFIRLVIA